MKRDNRKGYPTGTRGSVEIDASTEEPQTVARAKEFAVIVGDAMVEARSTIEERLIAAGFTDLQVTISQADVNYWFDARLTKPEEMYEDD